MNAESHKLKVADPSLAKSLKSRGGKLVADYGAFQVIEMDDSALTSTDTNRAELADEFNFVELNAQRLDTRAPQIKTQRKAAGAFKGRKLHLIQFSAPVKPEWRAALEQTGVRVLSYVPENAYLISGNAQSLAQMQSWAAGASNIVQWEGDYSNDFKIHPDARNKDANGNAREIGTSLFAVQLAVDAEANPATLALIHQLQLAPILRESDVLQYHNIIVALPPDRLTELVARPDVVSIQPYFPPRKHDERQDQIVAGNLIGNVPNGPGYLDWLAGKGFTQAQFDASGFAVDVSDSGIDNGTTIPGHFAFYQFGDTSQTSRVVYARLEGTPNFGSTLMGCDGHGALNAHIVGGYDGYLGFPHTDSTGYEYGLGVCPFVRLGSSVIFDPTDYTFPDFQNLQSQAYHDGARISNNSWGADAKGAYNSDSQAYDALVRDAQPSGSTFATSGNQEMVLVFVAGNAGPVTRSIDSPGTAKNVITVGAEENVRSMNLANGGNRSSGSDACGETDTSANSANDVHTISSRGPCSDGRMKPDLLAPGSHITGGVAQISPPPSPLGTGSAIDCFDSEGVCALPDSGGTGNPANFFPLGQQFFTVSSGTSHAAPAVSGACALLRQYFINNSLTPPSPAMTKACLMASARYLTGNNANDNLWSPNQGMGSVNLGGVFEAPPLVLRDQVAEDKFTASGQVRTFNGTMSDSSRSLRVTLAWTDAPGSTFGAAYNNNLNVTLTIGGVTYKGNVFKGAYSITGGTADSRNNVESIFLPPGITGDFTITVTAANINSDGVPNEAPSMDQDFALVALEVTSPAPPFSPTTASYNGLFYESNNVQVASSGAISILTSATGTFKGALTLAGKKVSFKGEFNSFGSATNVIPRKGGTPLTLVLQVETAANRITGTLTDGNWTATIRANQPIVGLSPLAGQYTLIVSGTNADPMLPEGDSYGVATVASTSLVKFKGSLADGTKISQGATISADGEWPFYVSLYGGQGELIGWLNFTNGGEILTGSVTWIKNSSAANLYPGGFDFQTEVTGSSYNAAANPLPGFGSGVVTLTGGDLSAPIASSVSFSGNKAASIGGTPITLTISSKSGLFKGSVLDPNTNGKISFTGVLLQNEHSGSGYFLGTDQSGRVFVGP